MVWKCLEKVISKCLEPWNLYSIYNKIMTENRLTYDNEVDWDWTIQKTRLCNTGNPPLIHSERGSMWGFNKAVNRVSNGLVEPVTKMV